MLTRQYKGVITRVGCFFTCGVRRQYELDALLAQGLVDLGLCALYRIRPAAAVLDHELPQDTLNRRVAVRDAWGEK